MPVGVIRHGTKIEEYGMAEECLKYKAKGMGSVRIAKALSELCGEEIVSGAVDSFLGSMKNLNAKNRALVARVQSEVSVQRLQILGDWKQIDDEFKKLLAEAKEIQIKIVGSGDKTKEIQYKDLRLLKDVLMDVTKVTETRARMLGQMQGDFHVHITKVENQYNDLKFILDEAEEKFPGLGEWITNRMLEKSIKK